MRASKWRKRNTFKSRPSNWWHMLIMMKNFYSAMFSSGRGNPLYGDSEPASVVGHIAGSGAELGIRLDNFLDCIEKILLWRSLQRRKTQHITHTEPEYNYSSAQTKWAIEQLAAVQLFNTAVKLSLVLWEEHSNVVVFSTTCNPASKPPDTIHLNLQEDLYGTPPGQSQC